MKLNIQNAMLQICGICNYKCKMCGHSMHNQGVMSHKAFSKTLLECQKAKIHTLIFAGPWGEPTLNPSWKSFLKESVTCEFNTILSTNGSNLDIDAINFLAESGLQSIQISFTGFDKESYESTYIKGDFSKLKKVLVNLKHIFKNISNAPKILINGVFIHDPIDSFVDKTYNFLYSCGYSDTEINIVRPNNFGGKFTEKNSYKNHFFSKSNLQLCSVLRDVIGINWQGDVTACACLDNDGQMIIGNILKCSIEDMCKSKVFLDMIKCFEKKDLSSLPMCSKCDVPYGDERNIQVLPSWLN